MWTPKFHLCPRSFSAIYFASGFRIVFRTESSRQGLRGAKASRRSVGHSAASRRAAHLARRQEKRSETGRSFSRRGGRGPAPPVRSRKPRTAEIWFTMIQLSVTRNEEYYSVSRGTREGKKGEGGEEKMRNVGRENGVERGREKKSDVCHGIRVRDRSRICHSRARKFARVFESSLFILRGALESTARNPRAFKPRAVRRGDVNETRQIQLSAISIRNFADRPTWPAARCVH